MIPIRLTLHQFLSYPSASVDFTGIHTACICGPNGAGKSALLEALTWGIWGQSRASSDDDLLHKGATEMQVEVIYQSRDQIYRILRGRILGGSSSLEWQIQTGSGWRSLTSKGIRATQQAIQAQLRLDYETFINSAYLRQGRADEFTIKRPSERKQILAEILKLGQYEGLAETCRDRVKSIRVQVNLLQEQLDRFQHQRHEATAAQAEYDRLVGLQEQLHAEQSRDQAKLETLQEQISTRRSLEHHHQQLTEQLNTLITSLQRTEVQWRQQRQQQQELESLINREHLIRAGCQHYEALLEEDQTQNQIFQQYQILQQHRQTIQAELTAYDREQSLQRQNLQRQLAVLQAQLQADHQILADRDRIEAAFQSYQDARTALTLYEQQQAQANPLLSQRQEYVEQLRQERDRLLARESVLAQQVDQLYDHECQLQRVQAAIEAVEGELADLEHRRHYQQQVLAKWQERRLFVHELQERQRSLQRQWQRLQEKQQLMQGDPSAPSELTHSTRNTETALDPLGHAKPPYVSDQGLAISADHASPLSDRVAPSFSSQLSLLHGFGSDPEITVEILQEHLNHQHTHPDHQPSIEADDQDLAESKSQDHQTCPLCCRPLSPELRALVLERQASEQQELMDQILVIREQLAVADREIEIMQEEHDRLTEELKRGDQQFQIHGRLQHQLETGRSHLDQLQAWQAELIQIQHNLDQETYGQDIRSELARLDQALAMIGYNDKDHALCRTEVERWRWAQSKYYELQKIQQRQQHLTHEIHTLQLQLEALEDGNPSRSSSSPSLAQSLEQIEAQLRSLNYDVNHHQAIRTELQQAQTWHTQWNALIQAQQQLPVCRSHCLALLQMLQQQRQSYTHLTREIESLRQQLHRFPSVEETEIDPYVDAIQQRRLQLDQVLSQLGAVQQRLQQSTTWENQQTQILHQLQQAKRQHMVYQELATAYGRNGIPAMIIENVLPELEAEANQILSRLTANQLHLQFVTQRSGRRSSKLIDTLDILIADPRGTRPYETYSGGEAFRINFAIRLALSRLLAQRAGARLQTLLIDEGFGTQDQNGRQQLVAAINAVAPDFARILVITHIPSLQDAFPHRIQVERTQAGSQVRIST